MKILVTSMTDLKASQHNRPHQFVRYLAKKHDVTVLSINDWWKNGQRADATYKLGFDDFFDQIDYRYLTHRKISPIAQEVLFHQAGYDLLNEGFDVQLNHHSLVTGYELSKRLGTVFDIADDLPAMIKDSPQIPRPLRPYGYALGSYFLRKGIAQAQHITLTCEALRKKYRIPASKSSLLQNGVDLNAFKNNNGETSIDSDGFIVGYVGVLREWVDFEPVFKALKMVDKRIKIVVVGKEGFLKETVDLARTCGVADRVKFTGQVDYANVPHHIAAMDVCLIPFKSNEISAGAVPLKLFEYMACGKPVISTKLQGVEAVAHDVVQYCSCVEDYAEVMTRLYEDEMLRKRIGRQGEELISTKYDWENISKELEGKLECAAGDGGSLEQRPAVSDTPMRKIKAT